MKEVDSLILSVVTFMLVLTLCYMFLRTKEKVNELETRINYAIDFIENRNDNVTLSRVQDIREKEILDILKGSDKE